MILYGYMAIFIIQDGCHDYKCDFFKAEKPTKFKCRNNALSIMKKISSNWNVIYETGMEKKRFQQFVDLSIISYN